MSNAVMSEMANALKEAQNLAYEDRRIVDMQDEQTFNNSMREKWGPDTKTNLNQVDVLLDRMPEEYKEKMFDHARLPNGELLKNNVIFNEWMCGVSRDANPGITILPNNDNPLVDIGGRIKEIEGMMRDDSAAYYKDEAIQKELRELYTAEESLKKRG